MSLKREVFEYKWAVEEKRKASRVNVVSRDNPFRSNKPLRPLYIQQINDATNAWRVNEFQMLNLRSSAKWKLIYNKSLLIDRHNSTTSIVVKQKTRHSKKLSKSILKNFCTLTGRGSAVIQKFLVNRFIIRDLVRFGLIKGLMHERVS